MQHLATIFQLLGDFVSQIPYPGSAPGTQDSLATPFLIQNYSSSTLATNRRAAVCRPATFWFCPRQVKLSLRRKCIYCILIRSCLSVYLCYFRTTDGYTENCGDFLYRLCYRYFVKKKANKIRIIVGSDRRPETKQGIEGKIDRFRSGRVRVRDRVRVRYNRSPIWTTSPILNLTPCIK